MNGGDKAMKNDNQTDNLAAIQESSQSWSVSNNQNGGLKSISQPMEDGMWGTFATKHSYLGRVKLKSRSIWAVLSMVCSMVPVILWAYCFIASGGDTQENGRGAVWGLIFFYYFTVGFPLSGLSIVFGAAGLNTRLDRLARISLSIKMLTISAVTILILWLVLKPRV
jgi:hypothetical protein